jgi:hypothetical protein
MTIDQAADIELVLGIEAAMVLRDILTQQPVGADHRLLAAHRWFGGVVDHQQMIADLVERILVALRQQGRGVGDRAAVLVEYAVTQFLRALDVAFFLRQPHFERAEPAQRGREGRESPDRLDNAKCCGPDIVRPQHLHQALRRSR